MNAPETARYISERLPDPVSTRWVHREAALGRLPHIRLSPKKLLFDPAEVDRYLAARRLTADHTARHAPIQDVAS